MFEEYRTLRDSGYTKEEAAEFFIKKAPMIILSSKADDYIGKNNKGDKKLCGWSGIVYKSNDVIEFENLKK